MSERPIFTYQTRPLLDPAQFSALDAYAELYGRAERSLFGAIQAGATLNDLKRAFLPPVQRHAHRPRWQDRIDQGAPAGIDR